jgi:hypothetical protein
MQIMELIEELERIAEDHPDAEVQIGHQPSWPLRETVAAVVPDVDAVEAEGDGEEASDVVWIVAGGHPDSGTPYAPKSLWELI